MTDVLIVVGALALVGVALRGEVPVVAGALVLLATSCLGVAAAIDRHTLRLPNVFTLTALALGLAAGFFAGTGGGALVGAALLSSPFLVVHLIDPGGMGFGDVKCAAAGGAVAGAVFPPLAPLAAVIVVLIITMALKAQTRPDGPLPLGPAIVLGTAIALALASVATASSPPAPCGCGGVPDPGHADLSLIDPSHVRHSETT
ncbi:MAG: prepilin peptidase [Actinomycetota bacterium]